MIGFYLFILLLLISLYYLLRAQKVKKYGITSYTLKGEEVRSKAERIIADYLTEINVNYQYEAPALSNGLVFRKQISHPDFYLPDYDVYVEYWGLVNADDKRTRSRYVKNMKWKMAQYHQNGIKFISIYPDNLDNLDLIFRKKFETVTCLELPQA